MSIKSIAIVPGHLEITDDSGQKHLTKIAELVRAADLPTFTIDNLNLLTTLAQIVAVVVQTLVERELLEEELIDGYDLSYVYETLEEDMAVELS